MSFKNNILWQSAFVHARDDAAVSEQARLASCYEAMRERANVLTNRIAADLPHMTIHDVSHLDALWEMAAIACGDTVQLNPAEAFVFGGAVLLHDAAMSLAAYPGGLTELKQTVEWRDLYARYSAIEAVAGQSAYIAAENRATADALRVLHAKQAENLPKISWIGPQGHSMFMIEDQQVRNFYGPKIGKLAYSHWWAIERVEEELSGTLGALAGVTNCTVDLLKVACLLRVADAMHLDQRRAPAFEFAVAQPTGLSADHWKFQERMAKPFIQGDALVYTAQPPFEVEVAEAWWTAFDALQIVDAELRGVDRVLRDRQKAPLVIRRVDGVHSPTDLARTVETIGWTPVDSTVRVTDIPKIVATLGGSKLYGNNIAAPVRELIQNGLDSITARRRLQSRPPKWGELQVILDQRQDGYWLCVEDNGVGMSTTVLTGPLIDFGNSFWRSSLAVQEFPGLASAGMKARGKYGIGFFSVFMLGDHVRVITRRFDRDVLSSRVLEFRHGLGSRPNLRGTEGIDVPIDGGTRVEVKLRINPFEPDGLLFRKNYSKNGVDRLDVKVAKIAPATDVVIKVFDRGETLGRTGAGDWTEIESDKLVARITGGNSTAKVSPWLELMDLRDDDGRIYGRARINVDYFAEGLVTVDGLAASKLELIEGILIGEETTASRNSALPIVPAPVLAAWSSAQALAFQSAEVSDLEKAQVAAVVLACGGDIAELPIVFWQKKWMTALQFTAEVKALDRLVVHQGEISHDEDDSVTKRAFEHSFEAYPSVAQTSRAVGSSSNHWIAAISKDEGSAPIRLVEQLLASAWHGSVFKTAIEADEGENLSAVGETAGSQICRGVTSFTRSDPEFVDAGQGEDPEYSDQDF